MVKLLEIAKKEIDYEINRIGFIDHSDSIDRFLDNITQELAKNEILKFNQDLKAYYENEYKIQELQEKLLQEIENNILTNYNFYSTTDINRNYNCCYYKADKEFNSWDEFNRYFKVGE